MKESFINNFLSNYSIFSLALLGTLTLIISLIFFIRGKNISSNRLNLFLQELVDLIIIFLVLPFVILSAFLYGIFSYTAIFSVGFLILVVLLYFPRNLILMINPKQVSKNSWKLVIYGGIAIGLYKYGLRDFNPAKENLFFSLGAISVFLFLSNLIKSLKPFFIREAPGYCAIFFMDSINIDFFIAIFSLVIATPLLAQGLNSVAEQFGLISFYALVIGFSKILFLGRRQKSLK